MLPPERTQVALHLPSSDDHQVRHRPIFKRKVHSSRVTHVSQRCVLVEQRTPTSTRSLRSRLRTRWKVLQRQNRTQVTTFLIKHFSFIIVLDPERNRVSGRSATRSARETCNKGTISLVIIVGS